MRTNKSFKIFWISIVAVAFFAMAYLIVPPLLNLNRFRDDIANALASEVGEPVEILGNVKISMLGYPMLSLENIRFKKMEFKTLRFRISWADIFNLSNSTIKSGIKISGAKIKIATLSIPNFGKKIMISNSVVTYTGKNYEILSGVIDSGKIAAKVRFNQHKYNINVSRGNFLITNPNEDLKISGKISINDIGEISAIGSFSINTNNFNDFFELPYPKIYEKVKMSMNFNWDGKGNFEFSKIKGTFGNSAFEGQVRLMYQNGKLAHKSVSMQVSNADLDLSSVTKDTSFLLNSDFDISISGNIKTSIDRIENIKSLSLKSNSKDSLTVYIDHFKAKTEFKLTNYEYGFVSVSGKIIGDRADNLQIVLKGPKWGKIGCLFSGNSKVWSCSKLLLYDGESEVVAATGTIFVTEHDFKIEFSSKDMSPDSPYSDDIKQFFGNRNGSIKFKIGNDSGFTEIKDGHEYTDFVHKNVMIGPWQPPLPESMMETVGNLAGHVIDHTLSYVFQSPDWSLSMDEDDNFVINHKDLRKLLVDMTGKSELAFLQKNIPVIISGKYDNDVISDLKIKIDDMLFSGIFNKDSISLKGTMIDFDKILDKKWFEEFVDNQYLNREPMLSPFGCKSCNNSR